MKIQLAVVLGMILAGNAGVVFAEAPAGAMPGAANKASLAQAAYVCPDCHVMAMKAGKCAMCGMDMPQMHMLGMKDNQAMLCACAAGCACDAKGVKDGKCACGMDVKRMTPKGMYVCACPDAKCCASISDKPGKCACGMDLKKVE